MNARLNSLLHEAETRLGASDQARLAEIVETFVAAHQGPPDFSPEELEHLKKIETEPFDLAEPSKVAALFARRG